MPTMTVHTLHRMHARRAAIKGFYAVDMATSRTVSSCIEGLEWEYYPSEIAICGHS